MVNRLNETLGLVEPSDAQNKVKDWVRLLRQRRAWTQSELARRSGVPATTISRLERTGLSSTETLFRILFALNELDGLDAFLKEQLRQARVLAGERPLRRRIRSGGRVS